MFEVENADFIADKLAAELLPLQEYREVLKNSLEAIERRMLAEGKTSGGRVDFDVDWSLHGQSEIRPWYLACADNGDGMNRAEIVRYSTTLAVQGAGRNQSLRGNQGMGLKISGPTRHKKGVLIRSCKNRERTMVQIGWNDTQYGLIPVGAGDRDDTVVSVAPSVFPGLINSQGSGTIVTFLGNTDGENTFAPPGRQGGRGWLLRYLNTRFFRLSNDKIEVVVRVPSGTEEDWPHSFEDAQRRRRPSFNPTIVYGTAYHWDEAADRQGTGWRGIVSVPGNPTVGIPAADVYWWIIPVGEGTDVSSRTNSPGSLAVLFDNELHDWRVGNQSNPYFARLGVLYGKNRIAFVIEPKGLSITSDFARAHVLVGGIPALESNAWLIWSDQFREQIPDRIRQTMVEEQEKLQVEDPDRVKRIRERLKDVMKLLRPRYFRRNGRATVRATTDISGADGGGGPMLELPHLPGEPSDSPTRRPRGGGRGIGSLLSQVDDNAGEPAAPVEKIMLLQPKWVSENDAEGMPIIRGNGHGLRDRAAALAGENARDAYILLLNRDFRGYQAILATMNEWANPEGDPAKTEKIKSAAEEWVEQKMIEAVQGLRQLENGSTWIIQNYDEALSPVALTAAFMADRYHTLAEVRRAAGSLRQQKTVNN